MPRQDNRRKYSKINSRVIVSHAFHSSPIIREGVEPDERSWRMIKGWRIKRVKITAGGIVRKIRETNGRRRRCVESTGAARTIFAVSEATSRVRAFSVHPFVLTLWLFSLRTRCMLNLVFMYSFIESQWRIYFWKGLPVNLTVDKLRLPLQERVIREAAELTSTSLFCSRKFVISPQHQPPLVSGGLNPRQNREKRVPSSRVACRHAYKTLLIEQGRGGEHSVELW